MTALRCIVPSAARLAAAALAVALVAFGAGAAQAQSVGDRLERMERDLSALQRYVYSGSGSGGAPGAGGADPAYRERVEVRLTALENELRGMTGRVEELGYAVQRLQDRLDKLVQDVDFRLTAIERAVQAGGGAVAGSGPTAAVPPTDAAAPPSAASATPSAPRSEDRPTNLAISSTAPRGAAARGTAPTESLHAETGTPAALPQGNPMEQYAHAQQLVAQTRYDEAEEAFREFLRQHPDHQLAGNARYWLGETFYVRKRYDEAAATFLETYQKDPKGSKAADSLLKLGLSLSAMRKPAEACVALDKLLREHKSAPGYILRRAEQERGQLACG